MLERIEKCVPELESGPRGVERGGKNEEFERSEGDGNVSETVDMVFVRFLVRILCFIPSETVLCPEYLSLYRSLLETVRLQGTRAVRGSEIDEIKEQF